MDVLCERQCESPRRAAQQRDLLQLAEAKIVIESWRRHYNPKRPHSLLGYPAPTPDAVQGPASPSGDASPATPTVPPRPDMH